MPPSCPRSVVSLIHLARDIGMISVMVILLMRLMMCTSAFTECHIVHRTALKPGRVIRVIRVTFSPGHPVYNLSGSDPDWIT